jgi:acyl-CoA synthetase (AMP-forming)/AMP-acid ligase II
MDAAVALNLALPVYRHARTMPDQPAVVVDETVHDYGELARSAARVAAWLNARRKPGKPLRVGVLAARSWQTYTGILGTVWADRHFIPLHPRQPAARLKAILEQTDMDALIVEDRSAAGVAEPVAHSAQRPRRARNGSCQTR